jgi:putative methyltransferase (TIGR04325 family)
MSIKKLVRMWCPPILLSLAAQVSRRARRRDGIVFEGDYPSWVHAQRVSIGYDSVAIFQRVRDAALKVKRSEAIFERDSVCFYKEEYRWPSLACLMAIAGRHGRLRVLDLGGSLGSYYYQHRKFISALQTVRWSVVEQKHFVTCGRNEFQDECLKFYESIADCLSEESVDVVFLSSVLQYLEQPYAVLAMLADKKVPYMLVDRTPFIEEIKDRLTVQHVADFKDSYPAWLFSRQRFIKVLKEAAYRPITYFQSDIDPGISNYQGMLLERV